MATSVSALRGCKRGQGEKETRIWLALHLCPLLLLSLTTPSLCRPLVSREHLWGPKGGDMDCRLEVGGIPPDFVTSLRAFSYLRRDLALSLATVQVSR